MLRHLAIAGLVTLIAWPAAAQVDSGAAPPVAASAASQEGWLGMGISCGPCSFQRTAPGAGRWSFSTLPSVFSVDDGGQADRAGIRAGDTLVAIDGVPLTSRRGGAAFGSVRPGQSVTIRYRRAGRERDAHLTAAERPMQNEYRALAEQARALARQQAMYTTQAERVQRQVEQVQHQVEMAQRIIEQSRDYQRALQELAQVQGLDSLQGSLKMAQLRRSLSLLDSVNARWQEAESAWAAIPPVPPVTPVPPTPAMPAGPPVAPVAPIPPEAWHREAGPLRYSGRLGDVLIEARGQGAVTTTVVSDSEVVVTSRDVSVRIALRPRGAQPHPPRN